MQKQISQFIPLVNGVNYKDEIYSAIQRIDTVLVKTVPAGNVTVTLRTSSIGTNPAHITNVMTFIPSFFVVGAIHHWNVESIVYANDTDKLANVTSFYINDADETADANNASVDEAIFAEIGDTVTIGHTTKFGEIDVDLNTLSSVSIDPLFEYSLVNGGWRSFSPTDGTTGFSANGKITFDRNLLLGWSPDENDFYSIRITRREETVGTPPIENLIKLDTKLDAPLVGLL